ncbi:MAG: hypothetical protein R6U21_04260 [Thermoplasmatota archaeon]
MKKTKTGNKNTNLLFSFFFRIILFSSMVLAVYKQDYVWVFGSFIGLCISFLPALIKKDRKMTLPWIFDFLIALVSILHIGGRLLDYYIMIPGYQLFTRFFISALVAFLSLAIIYILDEHWDGLIMDRYAMAFVTVVFTMAMGVFLEFIKWIDSSGGYYVRSNQVLMMNLTADTVAGILIAVIGVNLIKRGTFRVMTNSLGNEIDEMFIHRKQKNTEDGD